MCLYVVFYLSVHLVYFPRLSFVTHPAAAPGMILDATPGILFESIPGDSLDLHVVYFLSIP